MKAEYYKIKSYISGSNDKKFNFTCSVFSGELKEINDNPLNDHAFDQSWTKIKKFMNAAERRCKSAGLIRIS